MLRRLPFTVDESNTFLDNYEEQKTFYHKLWDHGGFGLWLGNYKYMLSDVKANRQAYDF